MKPIEALHRLMSETFVGEDGKAVRAVLLRPLDALGVEGVRARLRSPTPATPVATEIKELLTVAPGVSIGHLEVRWDGHTSGQYLDEIFACVWPVLEDGFGNAWSVEVDARSGEWGSVYFLCHDPPVVVFQAASFAEFLRQVGDEFRGRPGPLSRVHEEAAMEVWHSGGVLVSAAMVRGASDPIMSEVLACASAGSFVADLRSPRIGDGFPWGKFGSDSALSRPTAAPVFIVAPPGR